MTQRKEDQIYLSAHREGDNYVVRDQHGRKLAGVRRLSLSVDFDDVIELDLTVLDSPVTTEAKAHTGYSK